MSKSTIAALLSPFFTWLNLAKEKATVGDGWGVKEARGDPVPKPRTVE